MALNRRFRPREAMAGVPLWSLVAIFVGLLLGYCGFVYEYWLIRYCSLGFSLGCFAFGIALYLFRDWALFSDSLASNYSDASANMAGSEDR